MSVHSLMPNPLIFSRVETSTSSYPFCASVLESFARFSVRSLVPALNCSIIVYHY